MAEPLAEATHEASAVPLVEVDSLSVEIRVGGRRPAKVLNGVTFSMQRGETFGLVGESGSGKSMTLLALLGLLPGGAVITGGSIHWQGDDVVASRLTEHLRGDEIGTILQDPTASLNPSMKVGAQVAEPLVVHRGLSRRAARDASVNLLDAVGIVRPADRASHYPHQFSGGMRQRIVGAAAISCDPALLLADEPTTALDVTVQGDYLRLLERLQQESGAALLYVSHDLAVVARLCDRVGVMYGGRLVEVAATEELFANPRHPYTIGLLNCLPSTAGGRKRVVPIKGNPPDPSNLPSGCAFAPRCPASQQSCEVAPPELTEVEEGHQVACLRVAELPSMELWPEEESRIVISPGERVPAPARDALRAVSLVLDAVTKVFPGGGNMSFRRGDEVPAVDDVSLGVGRGSALSLVGETGSGKTTCAKLILDLERPTRGAVLFEGVDLRSLSRSRYRDYRRHVQAVFQDPFSSLNPRLSIGRAVAEPLTQLGERMSRTEVRERVAHVLEQVGLPAARVSGLYPHQLSGGQRQRVAIARATITGPDVLILDEPVSALDVSIRAQVMNILRDIQEKTGLGYLMISHDLEAVRYLSEEIAVMYRGRIVERGDAARISTTPLHPYTKRLLADAAIIEHGGPTRVESQSSAAVSNGGDVSAATSCLYAPRCPFAMKRCWEQRPQEVEADGRVVSCHLYDSPESC